MGWFEHAGWQKPKMWDSVAKAIFDLIYSMVERNDWESLRRFEENVNVSRGFKAGFITPTLHFLKPEWRMINNKTIDTVNFIKVGSRSWLAEGEDFLAAYHELHKQVEGGCAVEPYICPPNRFQNPLLYNIEIGVNHVLVIRSLIKHGGFPSNVEIDQFGFQNLFPRWVTSSERRCLILC